MGILGFEYLPFPVLSTLYGGFTTPVMKVTVNDNVLTLILSKVGSNSIAGLTTNEVNIKQEKNNASSASFSITNCYDVTIRSFVLNMLHVGSKISIQLGYGSVLRNVFVGYVDSLSYELSENPRIRVNAFDAVKLMMEGGKTKKTWKDGALYTKTISDIMDNYKDICPFPATNMLPSLQKHGQLQQNDDNYRFVKDTLCKLCDRDLIVKGGSAYLVNPYMQFGKLTELSFGSGLTSFSFTPAYKKVKVTVTGDKMAGAVGSSTVKTGDQYKTSMNKPQEISKTAPLKTSAECKSYAARLAFDAITEAQTASGSCIGIPDISPGVGLTVKGVSSLWDKRILYVDSASHVFNTSGYTTSFQIKGWT